MPNLQDFVKQKINKSRLSMKSTSPVKHHIALKKDDPPARQDKSQPKTKEELAKIRNDMMKKRHIQNKTDSTSIKTTNDSGFMCPIDTTI